LKGSSATSARAAKPAPRPTGRSSAKPLRTRTSADGFALTGPSRPPNPAFNAYRKDLADVGLAQCVIVSHYAEPLDCVVVSRSELRSAPVGDSEPVLELVPGEPFAMLENSVGWAWGYGGKGRRVGYVRSEALGAP
jgi:hypothetical protein